MMETNAMIVKPQVPIAHHVISMVNMYTPKEHSCYQFSKVDENSPGFFTKFKKSIHNLVIKATNFKTCSCLTRLFG